MESENRLVHGINPEEAWRTLGFVLDGFNIVEAKMATVIRLYIAPAPERIEWVERGLLNNLSINFGAKLKLVLAISREVGGPKLNQEKLHKLAATRNAMAHGFTGSAVRINRNSLIAHMLDSAIPYKGSYLVVESIKNNGEFYEVPRDEAVREFNAICVEVQDQLDELAKLLEQGASGS